MPEQSRVIEEYRADPRQILKLMTLRGLYSFWYEYCSTDVILNMNYERNQIFSGVNPPWVSWRSGLKRQLFCLQGSAVSILLESKWRSDRLTVRARKCQHSNLKTRIWVNTENLSGITWKQAPPGLSAHRNVPRTQLPPGCPARPRRGSHHSPNLRRGAVNPPHVRMEFLKR